MAYVLPKQSNTTAGVKHILHMVVQVKIHVAYVYDHEES
jgi:hypothetical protein